MKVYLVKNMSIFRELFTEDRTEVFSSLVKANDEIKNIMDVNKAFEISEDNDVYHATRQVTYSTLCDHNDGKRKVRCRIELTVKVVR